MKSTTETMGSLKTMVIHGPDKFQTIPGKEIAMMVYWRIWVSLIALTTGYIIALSVPTPTETEGRMVAFIIGAITISLAGKILKNEGNPKK